MISVIMVAHNAEEYVKSSIQSVLDSVYADFELIMVNDSSTDNTVNIVEEFNDCRIKIINNSVQMGTGSSRNVGLGTATGEIIMFVDSDDIIDSMAMTKVQEEMLDPDVDMVIFNWDYLIDKQTKPGPEHVYTGVLRLDTMVWNKAYRKSTLLGVLFPEKTHFEDVAFSIQCYLRSKSVTAVDNVLYHYRKVDSSITHSRQIVTRRLDIIKSIKILTHDIEALNVTTDVQTEVGMVVWHVLFRHLLLIHTDLGSFNEKIHVEKVIAQSLWTSSDVLGHRVFSNPIKNFFAVCYIWICRFGIPMRTRHLLFRGLDGHDD